MKNPKVYYSTLSEKGSNIEVANINGNEKKVLVPNVNPGKIAIDLDGGKIYWVEDYYKIKRANLLDGSDVEVVYNEDTNPQCIALDLNNSKIYWTDLVVFDQMNGIYKTALKKKKLDGSGKIEEVILLDEGSFGATKFALDLENKKLYFLRVGANYNDLIKKANLDASNIEDVDTDRSDITSMALDIKNGKIYYSDYNGIYRANLNGQDFEPLVTETNVRDICLDLDNKKMYWTTASNKIKQADLDGKGVKDWLSLDTDKSTFCIAIAT